MRVIVGQMNDLTSTRDRSRGSMSARKVPVQGVKMGKLCIADIDRWDTGAIANVFGISDQHRRPLVEHVRTTGQVDCVRKVEQ